MNIYFRKSNNKNSRAGFSVFELIFAVGLLALVGFALTTLLATASRVNAQDAMLTTASQAAQRELERIKNTVKTSNDFLALASTPKAFVSDDPRYIYQVTVEEENSSLKYVGVNIYPAMTVGAATDPETAAGKRIIRIGTYLMRP